MPKPLEQGVEAVTSASTITSNLKWLVYGILGIVIAAGLVFGAVKFGNWIKPIVDNKKASAEVAVKNAENTAAQRVNDVERKEIIEHYEYYNRIDHEVEAGTQEVNNASDDTEVISPEIDAAGRAALCGVYNTGQCNGSNPLEVQHGTGSVPQGNGPLPSSSDQPSE